jgi:hypothetical protein
LDGFAKMAEPALFAGRRLIILQLPAFCNSLAAGLLTMLVTGVSGRSACAIANPADCVRVALCCVAQDWSRLAFVTRVYTCRGRACLHKPAQRNRGET